MEKIDIKDIRSDLYEVKIDNFHYTNDSKIVLELKTNENKVIVFEMNTGYKLNFQRVCNKLLQEYLKHTGFTIDKDYSIFELLEIFIMNEFTLEISVEHYSEEYYNDIIVNYHKISERS